MFEDLAWLFGSPDGRSHTMHATAWSTKRLSESQDRSPVIWGREPLASRAGVGEAVRFAVRREWALRRMGLLVSDQSLMVDRLRPGTIAGGELRASLGRMLRAGAIVRIGSDGRSRLQHAITDADVEATGSIRAGADGAVVLTCRRGASDAVLRIGRAGAPSDPGLSIDALQAMGGCHYAVPSLLEAGEVVGARWSLERRLPGRRPTRLSRTLIGDVVGLLGAFPRSDGSVRAPREDLATIGRALPELRGDLAPVERLLAERTEDVPSVARHGDLWRGNLLTVRGRLSGAVDWDAWHPADLPATDLLQLLATEERHRLGVGLGDLWQEEPWARPGFRHRAAPLLGVDSVGPDLSWAVAVAWWAREVAGTLRRLPGRSDDRRWLDANVRPVLSRLSRGPERSPYG